MITRQKRRLQEETTDQSVFLNDTISDDPKYPDIEQCLSENISEIIEKEITPPNTVPDVQIERYTTEFRVDRNIIPQKVKPREGIQTLIDLLALNYVYLNRRSTSPSLPEESHDENNDGDVVVEYPKIIFAYLNCQYSKRRHISKASCPTSSTKIGCPYQIKVSFYLCNQEGYYRLYVNSDKPSRKTKEQPWTNFTHNHPLTPNITKESKRLCSNAFNVKLLANIDPLNHASAKVFENVDYALLKESKKRVMDEINSSNRQKIDSLGEVPAFIHEALKLGFYVKIASNNKTVTGIFLGSPSSAVTLQVYNHVFYCDATYDIFSIRKSLTGWRLFNIVTLGPDSMILPIAHVLIPNETTDTMIWVFSELKQYLESMNISPMDNLTYNEPSFSHPFADMMNYETPTCKFDTLQNPFSQFTYCFASGRPFQNEFQIPIPFIFMIDQASSYKEAIEAIYPCSVIRICNWHVTQSVVSHTQSDSEFTSISELLQSLLQSSNSHDFLHSNDKLLGISNNYIQQNLQSVNEHDPRTHVLWNSSAASLLIGGCHALSNSTCESFNSYIKKIDFKTNKRKQLIPFLETLAGANQKLYDSFNSQTDKAYVRTFNLQEEDTYVQNIISSSNIVLGLSNNHDGQDNILKKVTPTAIKLWTKLYSEYRKSYSTLFYYCQSPEVHTAFYSLVNAEQQYHLCLQAYQVKNSVNIPVQQLECINDDYQSIKDQYHSSINNYLDAEREWSLYKETYLNYKKPYDSAKQQLRAYGLPFWDYAQELDSSLLPHFLSSPTTTTSSTQSSSSLPSNLYSPLYRSINKHNMFMFTPKYDEILHVNLERNKLAEEYYSNIDDTYVFESLKKSNQAVETNNKEVKIVPSSAQVTVLDIESDYHNENDLFEDPPYIPDFCNTEELLMSNYQSNEYFSIPFTTSSNNPLSNEYQYNSQPFNEYMFNNDTNDLHHIHDLTNTNINSSTLSPPTTTTRSLDMIDDNSLIDDLLDNTLNKTKVFLEKSNITKKEDELLTKYPQLKSLLYNHTLWPHLSPEEVDLFLGIFKKDYLKQTQTKKRIPRTSMEARKQHKRKKR